MKKTLENLLFPLPNTTLTRRFILALVPSILLTCFYSTLPEVLQQTPGVVHYPSVFFAGLIGGTLPALICLGLYIGLMLTTVRPFLLIAPLSDIQSLTRFFMFIVTSLVFLGMLHVLRKALKKANESILLRDDFLNIVSHELKTPLTALKLNLDVVHRIQADENPDYASKNVILSSQRQIIRLERLICSMMDLTLFDSGQLVLMKKNCSLKKIIQDVVLTLNHPTIEIENNTESFEGHWDQLRIEQVVSNILHNAIKYGHGKPIEIKLGHCTERGVWFSVKDQGPGIKESDQTIIFERFQRVNTCTDVQGLGLGLYLTKKLVEIHNGKIELMSKPGEGALFKVFLPASN